MKGSLIKLIAFAVFLPALILISISGWFLYKNFENYQKVQNQKKYLQLTEKIEKVLVYLGQERGVSSIYSVSKGHYPNSKQILKQKRANFTNAINELKAFINKNPEFYDTVRNILSLTNKLPIIRKKIDSFKENYIKTYFFNYYTVLENELLNTLAKIQKKFPEKIKTIYELKFPLEKMIAYSGIVRGFGSYYITADTPMSEKEYKNVLLKYFHHKNILPLTLLPNDIKTIFQTKTFKKVENDVNTLIFYIQQANMQYYIDNEFDGYPIDALDYFELFTKRISFYKKAVDELNNKISNQLLQISSQANQNLIINAIIFVLGLIIFAIGIYLLKLIKSHILELSNLISSLSPILGKDIQIDISSTKGINESIKIVDEAIKITQEAIKKSEEATKAKSLFLANMSHEIRTPLNGILGFLEILKTTELTPEQEEYVNTISQSARNLLEIVNNILDISKIESNKVVLEEIDFKALDEFENTLEIFAAPMAQKHLEYATEISPNLPSIIKGDVLKIKEILTNLINNAIKFTPEKGTISVKILLKEIKDNKAKIYFEVKDTGIGMSEEQKQKVFEAFTQADESITRKYGGTGLGLAIVKSYLEMMGSKIEVESEINKGSKFYFTLEFDIIDATPKYNENSLSHKTIAILNTSKESLRKEFTLNYLNFFGVSRIGINSKDEYLKIKNQEEIDAILIFYEESDKYIVNEFIDLNIPIIFVSSMAYKTEIDEFPQNLTIFDPNLPSKTYNNLKELKKEKQRITTAKKTEEKPLYKLKVLIAEDNPINRKLLLTKLKALGIEADSANNGLEAFNKYSMNPEKYDAIFTDIQMPVMDGVELTQEILEFEKEEELPHTPIIAVTANALKGDREKFLGTGMDDYISKPINSIELENILKNIAQGKYSDKNFPKIENETKQIQQTKTSISHLIIGSESEFLIDYLKDILKENIIVANNIKALEKSLKQNPNATLILEEEFNDADINKLIQSIKKEFNNIKIVVIGENEYNANAIIKDLNPETIQSIINKLKGE